MALEADVIVVGGGSAGIAAATAAARHGADVLLVERYGSLGGMATGGLVILLLSLDDGHGTQVVGGLCQEVVDRLVDRAAAVHPSREEWATTSAKAVEHYRQWGLIWGRAPHAVRYNVAYDPEEFRFVTNTMVTAAGVRLRLHTWVGEPVVDDHRITHLIVQSKAGREALACKFVIDCSGDGDVFAAAGEPFEHRNTVPWLWFRMGGVDNVGEALVAGRDKFFPTLGGRYFRSLGNGRTLMPWGASDAIDRKIDAVDPDDLTYAELTCRQLVMKEIDRLRAEVPQFRKAHINDIAWQLGIYGSRRLQGRYQLTSNDRDRPFDDSIAKTGNWSKAGEVYHIPYRCLQPQGVSNLLVAGRCISVDAVVHHSTKEIPPCFATGEAAGTAAAVAVSAGIAAWDVPVDALRSSLLAIGAIFD